MALARVVGGGVPGGLSLALRFWVEAGAAELGADQQELRLHLAEE